MGTPTTPSRSARSVAARSSALTGELAMPRSIASGSRPTARANAARDGRDGEFDAALDAFCDQWDRGTEDRARFEKAYLLAVGTREAR